VKSIKERELEKAEERRGEDPQERTARELIELLNELRVILPGGQVLFAFLLTVPFTQRFPDLDDLETGVFFMTLLCTAVATVLLIAPSAHHRILWRGGVREQRLALGNMLTIAGLIFLLPAIVGVVFVITAFIFGLTAAVVVTGLLALFFVLLWFVLPLRYREGED
jgi:membrane-associated HD superfamily phosphohydrolase